MKLLNIEGFLEQAEQIISNCVLINKEFDATYSRKLRFCEVRTSCPNLGNRKFVVFTGMNIDLGIT